MLSSVNLAADIHIHPKSQHVVKKLALFHTLDANVEEIHSVNEYNPFSAIFKINIR
jgi:hypothetical protein